MKLELLNWSEPTGWTRISSDTDLLGHADLVLFFGDRRALESGGHFAALQRLYPTADIAGCSTSGQILDGDVTDDGVVAAAIRFDNSRTNLVDIDIASADVSYACGTGLGRNLAAPDLRGVFVLSDGVGTNASALIGGLVDIIGTGIPVTGGLAGDGADFKRTLVGGNCEPAPGKAVAIGFYGDAIRIGHGSNGGWKVFGPARRITRSSGNVLFELDGKPALDLYKRYLGEEADNLPGSALLFPLKIWSPNAPEQDVVRTIVGLDESTASLIFAANVPTGYHAQLMRGVHDNLIVGAEAAASAAAPDGDAHDQLAILISCVGRKLLLHQRVSEETEAVREILGPAVAQIGFYSYGEISPHSATGACEIHNQTMTVTTLSEAA